MLTKKVKKNLTQKVVKKKTKKVVVKQAEKKVAKKPVKKTSSLKKAIKVNPSQPARETKNLIIANEQTCFWVTNGQILNSLVALRDALEVMEKEVYSYHAGNAQNDFSNWVAVVLKDNACARDLESAKTSRSAKTTIVRHLKTYSV